MSDILQLRPFKRFCMTIGNLPSSYVESLTYAELIYWLCDYLEKTVIPTVNNNSAVVKELQDLFTELENYVINYFDNLDVQEEINNKLDDMVESEVFENILMNYANVTKVYNTTVEMLQDIHLKNNQKVKTLGYHQINDGGGAEFLIKNTNTDFPTNNGLFAELIISENINVKQFGAYGDGINDDSLVIQNAINFIKNKVNSSNLFSKNINTLNFNAGKYKISNTLILSPLVHLNFNSTTTFLNYADCCLKIKPSVTDFSYSSDYPARERNKGKIITGNGGLIIINKNNDITIGIEMSMTIDEYNELSSDGKILNTLADSFFENLTINFFNVAIKINSINFYINTFNNLKLYNNDIAILITNNSVNAGEKIVFNDCEFGSNKIVLQNNANNFNTYWNKCSFDYGKKYVMEFTKASQTYINNCHIEHNTNEELISGEKIGQFISNNTSGINKIYFSNIYMFTGNTALIPLTNGEKALIFINNIEDAVGTITNANNSEQLFMNLSPVAKCEGYYSNKRMCSLVINKIIDYLFLDEEIGTLENLKNYNIDVQTNVIQKSIIEENEERALLIGGNTDLEHDNFTFTISTKYKIPVNNKNLRLVANCLYKINDGTVQCRIISKYFDRNDVQIGSSNTQYGTSLNRLNEYITNEFPLGINKIPENAVSMTIGFSFTVNKNGTSLYIKNLCLNEI